MSFSKRVIFLPSLDLLSNLFSSIPEMIFPEKKKKEEGGESTPLIYSSSRTEGG